MTCINPNQERCGYRRDGWEPNQCFRLGGPPFKCQREGQTPAPATQESSEPEIVAQAAAESLARRFHTLYERLASAYGYSTRRDTREFTPGSPNGQLMIAVCKEIIAEMEAGTLIVTRVRQH